MAIPTTNTAVTLFSSQRPAWEKGIEMVQGHATRLFTSRAGLEQRQQGRLRSQWKLSYTCYLDGLEREERDRRNRAELVAPVVVPFWPEEAIVSAMLSNSVTISRTATDDWFAIGDYIYLTDGTTGQFRVISGYGVSLQQLTLEAVGSEVLFSGGDLVYPCRLCIRDGGMAEHIDDTDFSLSEEVRYLTL